MIIIPLTVEWINSRLIVTTNLDRAFLHPGTALISLHLLTYLSGSSYCPHFADEERVKQLVQSPAAKTAELRFEPGQLDAVICVPDAPLGLA